MALVVSVMLVVYNNLLLGLYTHQQEVEVLRVLPKGSLKLLVAIATFVKVFTAHCIMSMVARSLLRYSDNTATFVVVFEGGK